MKRDRYAQIVADAFLEPFTLLASELAHDRALDPIPDRRRPHRRLSVLAPMVSNGSMDDRAVGDLHSR